MDIQNKRLSDEEFFREREEVLAEWPTGRDVDLDEAIEYHRSMSPERNYVMQLARAKREGVKILNGPGGADTLQRQSELIRALQDEGQADAVATWIDALTRNHHFKEADEAVEEAERTGRVVLNGFPIVHYSVAGTRKMTDSVHLPVCVYANGPDLRLITEVTLAGGFTATSLGGSLCAFWGYTANMPPETVIRYYQYCRRLEGYYQEHDVPILSAMVGEFSGMIPSSLRNAPTVIEALMGAEQGIKHMRILARSDGNLIQDISSAITIRKVCREYLNRFGYNDVQLYVSSHHPYGRYPEDAAQAFAIIGLSPIIAVLAGCEVVSFNTIDEARQIPRKEQNVASHRYVRMMLNMVKDQDIDILGNKAVVTEAAMIEREMKAILDKVLELGDGDVITGSSRAMEAGVLDMPFATTQRTLSKVLGVRDAQGAVRYLEHGNLPFTSDIVEYHKEKIAARAKREGREISYEAVVGDIYALSNGGLISSP